jgi:hypothetical protein
MKRVIVVGPGAAGKSTLAARLGEITRLPVIELDTLFWRPGLAPTPRDERAAIQRRLAAQESWIMDGDLGPYDVLDVRLQAADAIVFLDFSPLRSTLYSAVLWRSKQDRDGISVRPGPRAASQSLASSQSRTAPQRDLADFGRSDQEPAGPVLADSRAQPGKLASDGSRTVRAGMVMCLASRRSFSCPAELSARVQ